VVIDVTAAARERWHHGTERFQRRLKMLDSSADLAKA
jgi:hypothetical protein